jgi:hypothetical protein
MSVVLHDAMVVRSGEAHDGHVLIPRIGPSKFLRGQRFNLQTGTDCELSVIDDVSTGLIIFANSTAGSVAVDCAQDCPERAPLLRELLDRDEGVAAAALCRSILAEHLQELACLEYQRALWYGDELACAMDMLDLLASCEPQPRY